MALTSSLPSVIQLSISPVILISGLGGLMITLSSRLARIVDRTRALSGQARGREAEDTAVLIAQLDVL